jgi:undecaprenyl-diphosphatase
MKRWWLYALAAVGVSLSLLARFYGTFPGEESLVRGVQNLQHPIATYFMEFITLFGTSYFLIVTAIVAVLALFALRRRREGFVALGILGLLLLSPLLKLIVDRPRPPLELVGLSEPFAGSGFPSGHTYQSLILFAFLLCLATMFINRTWLRWSIQISLVALILAVGVSRIYLGAHWPSDVLGAYVIGGCFLLVLLLYYRRLSPTSDPATSP